MSGLLQVTVELPVPGSQVSSSFVPYRIKYRIEKDSDFCNKCSHFVHDRGNLNKRRHNRRFGNYRNTKISHLVKKLEMERNTNNPT